MKFRYKRFGSSILRPVIVIELVNQDKIIPYEVLVDSGADICIFDAQIGELLGLDITSGSKQIVSGITGYAESYYIHQVTMKVGGWPYTIEAGFLPNINSSGYGVVGQKGFFDQFIIKFDLVKEEIELKAR